jgi:alpha-galactosidase
MVSACICVGLGHTASLRDLWEKKDRGSFTGSFSTDVPEHGVVFVRIH